MRIYSSRILHNHERYIESRLLTVTCLNVIRFHAAAIAAFGTITLDHHVDKVPVEMKSKFKEIADEKALVLHDHLEVRDRYTRLIV